MVVDPLTKSDEVVALVTVAFVPWSEVEKKLVEVAFVATSEVAKSDVDVELVMMAEVAPKLVVVALVKRMLVPLIAVVDAYGNCDDATVDDEKKTPWVSMEVVVAAVEVPKVLMLPKR